MSEIVAVITITADGLIHVHDGHGTRFMSADFAQMYYDDLLVKLLKERAKGQVVTPDPSREVSPQGNVEGDFLDGEAKTGP